MSSCTLNRMGAIGAWLIPLLLWSSLLQAAEQRCLLLFSYHSGYQWNDGIERGAVRELGDACEIRRFYLDSKRNKSPQIIEQRAQEALQLIEQWEPDLVIAADDNAARYVVAPHLKGKDLPVLFCGINWEANRYGFPAENVSGMIEVSPIVPLIKVALQQVPIDADHAHFLAADVLTQHKEFERFKYELERKGIELEGYFAETMEDWVRLYTRAQRERGILVMGNPVGIQGWDLQQALERVEQHGLRSFSISTYSWMKDLAHLSMTKVAEEQGEWVALQARRVLQGIPISDVPMTTNKRWEVYVNQELLDRSGVQLPGWVMKKAAVYQ